MTDLEIIKSAIGEKIRYMSGNYTVTEIFRNHVLLVSEGKEDEMCKVSYVAKEILETRKILAANKQPGIETYFEKFGTLVNDLEYYPPEQGNYIGRYINLYDAGKSMRNDPDGALRAWGDKGNGFRVLSRYFRYSSQVIDYSKSQHKDYVNKTDFEFRINVKSASALKVEGDEYTPDDSKNNRTMYFSNIDDIPHWKNMRFFNSTMEEQKEIISQYAIEKFLFHAFEGLQKDLLVKRKLDNYTDELWITDALCQWVNIVTIDKHENDDHKHFSGCSEFSIQHCPVDRYRQIRPKYKLLSVPKRLTTMSTEEFGGILTVMMKDSVDAFMDPKETNRL